MKFQPLGRSIGRVLDILRTLDVFGRHGSLFGVKNTNKNSLKIVLGPPGVFFEYILTIF